MPKIDFTNKAYHEKESSDGGPVELVENMPREKVFAYIEQELAKIYKCNETPIIKEMMKEDLYERLQEKSCLPLDS
jgi:hypothetical protein